MTIQAGSLPSRAAAVCLLLLVAAIVKTVAVAPTVGRMLENRESINIKRTLLGRLMNASNTTPTSPASLAGDPSLYCSGSTDAIVLAAVQGNLQSIAAAERASIRSAQPLSKLTRGSLEMIGLGVDVSGEPQAILRFIYGIESMTPALFVQKAALHRSQQGPGAGEEPGSSLLEVQLDIYCALRPPSN